MECWFCHVHSTSFHFESGLQKFESWNILSSILLENEFQNVANTCYDCISNLLS